MKEGRERGRLYNFMKEYFFLRLVAHMYGFGCIGFNRLIIVKTVEGIIIVKFTTRIFDPYSFITDEIYSSWIVDL
jgi:hypothetical protein